MVPPSNVWSAIRAQVLEESFGCRKEREQETNVSCSWSEFQAQGEEYVFLTMLEQSHVRIGVFLELSLNKDGRHLWKNAKSQKSLRLSRRLTWNIKALEFHRISWYNIWPCLISSVITNDKFILQWSMWETVSLRSPSQSTSERDAVSWKTTVLHQRD